VTPGFLISIRKPNRISRKTVSISASDELLLSLIKLRLKQRLLFIIRLWRQAIESDRCLRAKRASPNRLFIPFQNLGATLARLLTADGSTLLMTSGRLQTLKGVETFGRGITQDVPATPKTGRDEQGIKPLYAYLKNKPNHP
jgi:hypothetical protein